MFNAIKHNYKWIKTRMCCSLINICKFGKLLWYEWNKKLLDVRQGTSLIIDYWNVKCKKCTTLLCYLIYATLVHKSAFKATFIDVFI